MSTPPKWIVCEESGPWAAALRVAISRSAGRRIVPRLYEVRSITELASEVIERQFALSLIEIRPTNLAQLLRLLSENEFVGLSRFVALVNHLHWLGANSQSRHGNLQLLTDVLWEAGATDVVESPRHMHRLLADGERYASAARPAVSASLPSQSLSDWAWSLLPWQDS